MIQTMGSGDRSFLAHFWHAVSHLLVWSGIGFQQVVWMFTTIETLVVLISTILYSFFPYMCVYPSFRWKIIQLEEFQTSAQGTFAALRGIHRAEGWGSWEVGKSALWVWKEGEPILSFTPWKKNRMVHLQIHHPFLKKEDDRNLPNLQGIMFQPLIFRGENTFASESRCQYMHLFSYHSRSSRWPITTTPKFGGDM